MRKSLLHILMVAFVSTIAFIGTASAQVSKNVYGTVHDSNGGVPAYADLSWNAYIITRPSEILTKTSAGSNYDEPTATWLVNVGNFPTAWSAGDVMRIDFTDANGPTGVETGSDQGTLDSAGSQNFGDTSLPVELSLFEALAGDAVVKIVWKTESEVDNLGFNVYRSTTEDGNYIRINETLIESKGTPTTTTEYEFVDNKVRNGITYYYKLEDVSLNGEKNITGPVSARPDFGLTIDDGDIPEVYSLMQNYPNPFNPETVIRYDLPENTSVQLIIYDLLGREVRRLVDGEMTAGAKSITWDGLDNAGRQVSSGLYIYKIVAGEFVATKKMLLQR